jgi:hypothetical protein
MPHATFWRSTLILSFYQGFGLLSVLLHFAVISLNRCTFAVWILLHYARYCFTDCYTFLLLLTFNIFFFFFVFLFANNYGFRIAFKLFRQQADKECNWNVWYGCWVAPKWTQFFYCLSCFVIICLVYLFVFCIYCFCYSCWFCNWPFSVE